MITITNIHGEQVDVPGVTVQAALDSVQMMQESLGEYYRLTLHSLWVEEGVPPISVTVSVAPPTRWQRARRWVVNMVTLK